MLTKNFERSDIPTNEIFYDKLTFIYLAMPKFNKTLDVIETRFDKKFLKNYLKQRKSQNLLTNKCRFMRKV